MTDHLKAKHGRLTELANALGIKPSSIKSWKRVPAERVTDVAQLTNIPREQLRPDIFGPTEKRSSRK